MKNNKFKNFVSCHVHPNSFDSASTPETFIKRELELELAYTTVTDHGTLSACRHVYELAHTHQIKPILGLEGFFRDDQCPILKEAGILHNDKGTYADYQKYHHLTLHFLDQQAYEMGVQLLSLADHRAERHGSERKPLFDWKDLEQLGGYNVTMTSSCLIGMVNRHLVQGDRPDIALKYFDKLRSITKPGHFYVELFPHICDKVWKNGVSIIDSTGKSTIYWSSKRFITNAGEIVAEDLAKEFNKKTNKHTHILAIKERHKFIDVPDPIELKAIERIEDFLGNSCSSFAPNGDVQLGANKFVLELAQKYHLPLLIGDDAHFATPHEKIIQDIRLMTISNGGFRFANSYHRQSSQEAYEYFHTQMGFSEYEFEKMVDQTHEWAARFNHFSFKNEISLPTKFYLKEGESSVEHIMQLIKSYGRFNEKDIRYKKRLLEELKLLGYNGVQDLLPYFFTPEEICRVYNENGMLTGAGRGCFIGSTEVVMKEGIKKPIDQIVVGDWVYSHDKKIHQVKTVWKYFITEPLYELSFLSPPYTIQCTADHQFYTTVGWVAAKDLVSFTENRFSFSLLLPAYGEGVFYLQEKRLLPFFSGWVYDLHVEEVFSYNVEGIAVHNSSPGLLLNYLLGITHVDPIRYELSMERFITKDRILSGKLPDIDLDLQSRDFLTEHHDDKPGWLEQRFGDHYAQISTEITLKLRSSVKDVARVRYGKVSKEIEDLTKAFEVAPMGINDLDFINGYKAADGQWIEGAKDRNPALKTYIKKYPEDWLLVQKLIGLQRTISKHACLPKGERIYTQHPLTPWKEIQECDREIIVTGHGSIAYATLLCQGEKEVYEYLVSNHKKIRCTADHQILTQEGWMEIQQAFLQKIPLLRGLSDKAPLLLQACRAIGKLEVFDLSVDHPDHSFIHESGLILHNCAFVFANKPIHEFIPMTSVGDTRVTQYTAPSVELSGGLKNDLLVLTSLVDINEALKLIQKEKGFVPEEKIVKGLKVPSVRILPHQNAYFDIWDLPEDQKVFDMIASGDTATVFQFSTSSAVKWLTYFNQSNPDGRKLINSIESMATFTALDRPGPLDAYVEDEQGNKHNMLVEYTRRAMGLSPIGNIEALDKIIPEYQGIAYYQEAVQKIYYELTNCTRTEAEEFRSDLAKKKKSKIEKAYPFFLEKVSAKLGMEEANKIWATLESWSQYGFCKSHAISYSIVAYACAFLKYHYPLQWWCAVLKNATKEEITTTFWRYCKKYVRLPDIHHSSFSFQIVENSIQAPLSLLDRIGETAHNHLIENKPYHSLLDFCEKIVHKKLTRSLTSRVVHNLIIVGALDSLFPSSPSLSIYDKLMMYEETMGKLTKIKSKNLLPYAKLNALNIYQLKKMILPIYHESLIDIIRLLELSSLGIHLDPKGYLLFRETIGRKSESLRFVSFVEFERLETTQEEIIPHFYPLKVGLIGYVQSSRVFRYPKPTYEKEALELIVDIEGVQRKFLKWGGLERESWSLLTGAVIGLLLIKKNQEQDFSLLKIIVIEPPLVLNLPDTSS